MTEPQIKGNAYLLTLAFLEAKYGPSAKEKLFARLAPADRAIFDRALLPIGWYSLAAYTRIIRAMDAAFGTGDLALATTRGTWAAHEDMTTVRRVLLKLVTTKWVIDKGTRLWPSFHNSGRWEVYPSPEKTAHAALFDLGVVDEAMCATLKGWIIGLLQLAGVKRPDVSHTECRVHGATSCVYHVSWK